MHAALSTLAVWIPAQLHKIGRWSIEPTNRECIDLARSDLSLCFCNLIYLV